MTSGTIRSTDGLNLSYSVDLPTTTSSRATIVVVHGLGDHSRSVPYLYLTEFLIGSGLPVFRYDLRGHGRSEGLRGHIDSFEQHRTDLNVAIGMARSITSCERIYLVAASMGGLIAIDHAITDPASVNGVVAMAPALSSSGAARIVRTIVPVLSRLIPKMLIDPGLDLDSISRDQRLVAEYTSDPLFSTRMTIKAASKIMKSVERVNTIANEFSVPLLILHGSADCIVHPDSSADFIEKVGSRDKKRILYSAARHNLLIETNRDEAAADILEWLTAR